MKLIDHESPFPGMIVTVLCGSPEMVVINIRRNEDGGIIEVECLWFDSIGVDHQRVFRPDILCCSD